jgi:hypothetical protein
MKIHGLRHHKTRRLSVKEKSGHKLGHKLGHKEPTFAGVRKSGLACLTCP